MANPEKSLQITELDATPRRELSVKEYRGRVRAVRFDHTRVATGSDPDTVELCRLPAGARLLGGLSFIRWTAGGAALVGAIGTRAHVNAQTGAVVTESAARFQTALAFTAAGLAFFSANSVMLTAVDKDTILGEATVFMTTSALAAPIGFKVTGELFYVLD